MLKWPDFIEFDELNGKIVTKHTDEHAFRVWSLQTYNLLYVLHNESLTEFKIWYSLLALTPLPIATESCFSSTPRSKGEGSSR